jgi:hypothetical protein
MKFIEGGLRMSLFGRTNSICCAITEILGTPDRGFRDSEVETLYGSSAVPSECKKFQNHWVEERFARLYSSWLKLQIYTIKNFTAIP